MWRRWVGGLATGVLLCSGSTGVAASFYVDSGSGGGDGLSWGNAFQTVTEGLAALAATNVAGKGGVGGHWIMVTNGGSVYSEDVVVSVGHGGVAGSPNVLRGLGYPRVDGGNAAGTFDVDGLGSTVTDVTIDGFRVEGGLPDVRIDECDRITVANCVIHDVSNDSNGLTIHDFGRATITNCVFFANSRSGISFYRSASATATVWNCVFMGNGEYGIELYDSSPEQPACRVINCCFFANGGNLGVEDEGKVYSDEITAYTNISGSSGDLLWTNCIQRNPGFARNFGDLNFNAVYQNSAAAAGGVGGRGMGPLYDRVVVPTSSKTYYVSPGGDDANTGEGADAASAWQTLEHAAANAVAGDTVVVQAGTYEGGLTITNGGSHDGVSALPVVYRAEGEVVVTNVSNPIELYGVAGVTVDGFQVKGDANGVVVEHSVANTMTNLDVKGGTGSGMRFRFSPRSSIVDCTIHHADGNGIHMNYGGIKEPGWNLVRDCRIHDNGQFGVEVHYGDCRFERLSIYSNGYSGVKYGHVSYSGRAEPLYMYNCSVYGNGYGAPAYEEDGSMHSDCYQHHGLTEHHYGGHRVYNCTFYGNARDGVQVSRSDGYLYNCILAGNGAYGVHEGPPYTTAGAEDVVVKDCLFWDNGYALYGVRTNHWCDMTGRYSDGTMTSNILGSAADVDAAPNEIGGSPANSGTIVADPRFAAVARNNYRLKAGSPAIDAGDGAEAPCPVGWTGGFPQTGLDLAGNPRVKQSAVDIGAYEWQPWSGTVMFIQ